VRNGFEFEPHSRELKLIW